MGLRPLLWPFGRGAVLGGASLYPASHTGQSKFMSRNAIRYTALHRSIYLYVYWVEMGGVKDIVGTVARRAGKGQVKRTPRVNSWRTVMSDSEPLTHKVPEVAQLLDVSRSTVYAGVATGEIPSIRIRDAIRIPNWWMKKVLVEGGK